MANVDPVRSFGKVRTGPMSLNADTGRLGPATPFGGVKRSDMGREWGLEGPLEFSSQKTISFHAG